MQRVVAYQTQDNHYVINVNKPTGSLAGRLVATNPAHTVTTLTGVIFNDDSVTITIPGSYCTDENLPSNINLEIQADGGDWVVFDTIYVTKSAKPPLQPVVDLTKYLVNGKIPSSYLDVPLDIALYEDKFFTVGASNTTQDSWFGSNSYVELIRFTCHVTQTLIPDVPFFVDNPSLMDDNLEIDFFAASDAPTLGATGSNAHDLGWAYNTAPNGYQRAASFVAGNDYVVAITNWNPAVQQGMRVNFGKTLSRASELSDGTGPFDIKAGKNYLLSAEGLVESVAGGIASVVQGTGINIDDTDPLNPIVSATGVQSVSGSTVDNTDPLNPVISSTGGGSLPAGGTTGQGLRKNSTTDGDAGWYDDFGVPPGGTDGDFLKTDGIDGHAFWSSVKELPSGGSPTQVVTLDSDYVARWENIPPSSGGSGLNIANPSYFNISGAVSLHGSNTLVPDLSGDGYSGPLEFDVNGQLSPIGATPIPTGIYNVSLFVSGFPSVPTTKRYLVTIGFINNWSIGPTFERAMDENWGASNANARSFDIHGLTGLDGYITGNITYKVIDTYSGEDVTGSYLPTYLALNLTRVFGEN